MKSFLIVDDSAVIRKVTRRIVERLAIEASEAEDGAQALEACEARMPDGIFVDEMMPEMNGCEFVRKLREMPGGKEPKVIFCTSEHDVGQIAKAKHCGADDFILKPFDKDMMTAKLQSIGLA